MRNSLITLLILFASPLYPQYSPVRDSSAPSQTSTVPRPVRNDVAQPGEEIITIRYYRIKKGTFDQFLKASQEDVWPYFDKIGARVIGMWKVFPADSVDGQEPENKDYDEVYLSTRYASLDHWKATRDAAALGGNGPDFEKLQRGLNLRDSLTISTKLIFLKGAMKGDRPLYMPGLNEVYEKKQ